MNPNQLIQLKELIDSAESAIKNAKKIIKALAEGENLDLPANISIDTTINLDEEDGTVVEGVFTGQNMLGNDAKTYQVPANYASKSKLVPGDQLKLVITNEGKFVYKQIGPVDRRQVLGTLKYDDGNYRVYTDEGVFNVLQASITYFKAELGDQVAITIPTNEESAWAAVENVIPSGQTMDEFQMEDNYSPTPEISTEETKEESYTI